MHRDRKTVFVDRLGWQVPVVNGDLEIDQFDGDDAIYLIAVDEAGGHAGSLRLLPTAGPHLLADGHRDVGDRARRAERLVGVRGGRHGPGQRQRLLDRAADRGRSAVRRRSRGTRRPDEQPTADQEDGRHTSRHDTGTVDPHDVPPAGPPPPNLANVVVHVPSSAGRLLIDVAVTAPVSSAVPNAVTH